MDNNSEPTPNDRTRLDHALDAARRGLRVFRLPPGRKKPPPAKFYEIATTDEATIRRWWTETPDANIGVSTDALVVLDIDRRLTRDGKPAVDGATAALALGLSHEDFDTLAQQTPSGVHYVWRVPEGQIFRGSQGELGVGLDIRAFHNYIVWSGSTFEPSDDGHGTAGDYQIMAARDVPTALVPAKLAARLGAPAVRASDASREPLVELDQPANIAWAVHYLTHDAPPAIQGRRGDETTFKVACVLKDHGISEDMIYELLSEHYNARCEPPWAEEDLEEKARRAYLHGTSRPGCACPEVQFEGVDVPPLQVRAVRFAPRPLPPGLPAVAPFDPNLLPDSLRAWVTDIAERMQCPPDFIAVTAIVALASVLGRKLAIRPQQETTWCETANLWGCIVGRPGGMKSPAMSAALAPLRRLDGRAAQLNDLARGQHAIAVERHKLEQSVRTASMKERLKKDANADLTGLTASAMPSAPRMRRYLVHDTTYEALGIILCENPNGVLAFRDELVSLLKPLDRDENAAARGFFLAAWNGNDPYTFDRITRESVYIEACCLSLLGATQPARLAAYVSQAVRGGAGDDGMIQRFGLLVWPDATSAWREVDRQPNAEAARSVDQLFDRLDALDPAAIGAERDADSALPFLRFDRAALARFRQWRAELEARIRGGDLHPAMEAHLSKYRGLAPKLALIFHLADGHSGPVSMHALQRAVAWMPYLESHARRAYASVTAGEVTGAKAILAKLRSGALAPTFTARDVHQAGWSGLSTTDDVVTALSLLVDLDWLSETIVRTPGRPKTTYSLGPGAFEPFEGSA